MQDFVKLMLTDDAQPLCAPTRWLPPALGPKVKAKLDDLEWSGTIKKVMQPMEFFAPIVMTYKKYSATDVRLTTDFRHLNKYVKPEPMQIPTVDEIAARVQSATVFSTLDMTDSFFQVSVTEESQHLLSFATPFVCATATRAENITRNLSACYVFHA